MGTDAHFAPGPQQPLVIDVPGTVVPDGGTVTAAQDGQLYVAVAGSYLVRWTVQDGYGCNGDPITLLSDGVPVATWTTSYGDCGVQYKAHVVSFTAGSHHLTVSMGCQPPGNGDCIISVHAAISRI